MTTIKNRFVRFILLPSLFIMVVIFQGCGGGGSGGGGGGGSGNSGTENSPDPDPVPIVNEPKGSDDLAGIGQSTAYDCTHKVRGPAYSFDSDTGVRFERSYVHANDCAQISEKIALSTPPAADLHVQVAIYNPLDNLATVDMKTITIASGQTVSDPITVDMTQFVGATLITMQIVSTDSSTIKVGKIKNLNIYRFTSSTEPPEFIQVSSGYKYSCAIRADHKAVCWGDNTDGQLGTGNFDNQETPTLVTSLDDVKQISAGDSHTCAISGADRHVFCWGKNSIGQLGIIAGASVHTPVQVAGLSGVLQVEVSKFTTCILAADLTMSCWGSNNDGIFADGTTNSTHIPTKSPELSDIKQISLGSDHACALSQTGTLKCWGKNSRGQLGDGSTLNNVNPVAVTGLNQIVQISAGGLNTCAVNASGELFCWGLNTVGQLGLGHQTDAPTPTIVDLPDVKKVVAGSLNTCALKKNGTAFCWGANSAGQLGNGISSSLITEISTTPSEVRGLTFVENLSMLNSSQHVCVLLSNKGILCWGDHTSSQLGTGSVNRSHHLSTVSSFQNATQIAVGSKHACAVHTDATVSCLGQNDNLQLGAVSFSQTSLPVPVSALTNVTQLALGASHSCALLVDKTVKCWGGNSAGQLGNGSTVSSATPVTVSGLNNVTQIVAGSSHTCALLEDHTGHCWGNNISGQLGNGSTANANVPTQISGLTTIQQLAASPGIQNTCAVMTDKTVKCWGVNAHGHIGTGNSQNVKTPFTLSGFVNMKQIQIGFISFCGLQESGSILCQGFGSQLGNGSSSNSGIVTSPVSVTGITTATKLSTGASCAILADQTVRCWGRNANLLVNGSTTDANSPVSVNALTGASEILNPSDSIYVRMSNGSVSSWGMNDFGQLRLLTLSPLARYHVFVP